MASMFRRRKSPAAKAAKALKARRRKSPAARLKKNLPGGKKKGLSPAVAIGAGVAAVGVAALSIGALRAPIATFGKRAAKSVGKRTQENAVDKPAESAEKVGSS